jgi:hypothetical protein
LAIDGYGQAVRNLMNLIMIEKEAYAHGVGLPEATLYAANVKLAQSRTCTAVEYLCLKLRKIEGPSGRVATRVAIITYPINPSSAE